jgi:hypothetical protein
LLSSEGRIYLDIMKELEAIIARHQIPVVEVVYLPAKPVVYFSTCYGCGAPMLDGEEYRPEFCSSKCYCETSCIDREDG